MHDISVCNRNSKDLPVVRMETPLNDAEKVDERIMGRVKRLAERKAERVKVKDRNERKLRK
jgi:hypothetical protein